MAEDEKELYDEEDPEVPVDLFGMWGASAIADDEEDTATDEQEIVAEEAESVASETPAVEEPVVNTEPEIIADESEPIIAEAEPLAEAEQAPVADEPEPIADEPVIANEPEATGEEPTIISDEPTLTAEEKPVADNPAPVASDITDDDLDDLIDVPILPLPVESTEVTEDDLDDIRAPILSPGDPITIPNLTAQSSPDEQPAELSSPSLVEMVQEQDAVEALGSDLTAPQSDDPLTLFKKLRDLAEELPHNVYDAFKASKMSATLDEIIAGLEAAGTGSDMPR